MPRFALAVLLIAAAPGLAAAQGNDPAARCRNGALPFAASDANRLADADLQQLAGKTVVYIRESTRTPGVYVNLTRELRADGSSVHGCQAGRSPDGPWRACTSIGSDKASVAGSRDVGIWSVRARSLCVASASFGERAEGCFAIHRQGQVYAARQISGSRTFCIEGTITLK